MKISDHPHTIEQTTTLHNALVADHLSPEGRSRNMAAIRAKNTKPELALRTALRQAGATGYRLHRKDIPGRPDVAFTRWGVAVFVDGVFWHGHPDHWDPNKASSDYWRAKIARNIERDRAANAALTEMGWTVIRMWDQDVKANVAECTGRVLAALSTRGWKT
ncbi:MAG: very short patch repair endonuclease [Candidatus Nanopelagicales bacterium]